MSHRLRFALAACLALTGAASAFTNDHGLDARNFDPNTRACDDFYRHANGGWLDSNPIPAEYSNWGMGNELRERNLNLLKEILEETAKSNPAAGTNAQKIGDFYASAMDEAAIEKAGIAPIRKELAQIDAAKNAKDVQAIIRRWHATMLQPLFRFAPLADFKNSSMTIGYATQDGLGLPEREYYLKNDEASTALRAKYVAHVAKMLALVGVERDAAKRQADAVLRLETRLARASLDQVAMRFPDNNYHLVTVAQASEAMPHFDWAAYFKAAGVRPDKFSLSQPQFFAEVDKMLVDVPVADWQAYLRWKLASAAAPYLGKAFVDEDFEFEDRTLNGTKALSPRWKRALTEVDRGLGDALGELYVRRTFAPEAKPKGLEILGNIRTALDARIQKLDWMSPETKAKATEKLAALTPKIGYPDHWRDYSKLTIKRTASYFDNVRAAREFETRRRLAKIGKPVDRTEWDTTPQAIDAYYDPQRNEIVFAAGIMQPPGFDPTGDDAINYGALGSVMGHEMMHGFDDEGSMYDARGEVTNWWTDADRRAFEERIDRLAKQYDAYTVAGGAHVNGRLTLGENLADFGGLVVAYDAFQLTDTAKSQSPIDGLTPDQRFFLAVAQNRRRNYRDEAVKLMVNTDPHSPSQFRVLGPLSNMDAFAQAFSCKPGDRMVNAGAAKVAIW